MKSVIAASTLIALATAAPQGPPGGGASFGYGGPWTALPSCVQGCWTSLVNTGCSISDYSCLCKNSTTVDSINSCISSSSCGSSDKENTYQALAQMCADQGATVTAAPEASFSVTSGGSSWPTAFTTNSAWASAASAWGGNDTGPAPGWNANGGHGPFGGPDNGWGPYQGESSGSWTNGPWTSWWGTNGCPASTWSGWTSGSWSTSAPWTTWTGCTASTTASSVYTTIVTSGTVTNVETTTGFGIKVAEATNSASASSASSTSHSGALPTNFMLAGSAAGAVGVLAAALLL